MTEEEAKAWFRENVSRETFERLDIYAAALAKWQKAINLVSVSTLPELWTRHFLDSAQIYRHCNTISGIWLDIGSGGGFPGLVCAAMAVEDKPGLQFKLVESDLRKCTFLRSAAAEMGLRADILSRRIEKLPPQEAQIISARALAPLSKLYGYADRHLAADGIALFLKGATHGREINEALEDWTMKMDIIPSQTAEGAVILKIGDIGRA